MVNKAPVAAQIGFRSGQSLALIRIGYNENLKDIGPGNIQLLKCLEHETMKSSHELNLVSNPPW